MSRGVFRVVSFMTVLIKTESRSAEIFENNGQKIFSVLHRPEVELAPLLVIVHGFSSNKIGTNRAWVSLAEACTKKGFAALRFDLRGCGDSEGEFQDFTLQDMVSDIVTVLEAVRNYPGIDKDRISIFGSSLGGALAVLAAKELHFVKALVLWAAVASGPLWLADWMKANPECSPANLQQTLQTYKGSPLGVEFQKQFLNMDAAKIVAKLDLPLLHLHGEKDSVVTIQHQRSYRYATEHLAADFITYPELEHRLGQQDLRYEIFAKIISWLQEKV